MYSKRSSPVKAQSILSEEENSKIVNGTKEKESIQNLDLGENHEEDIGNEVTKSQTKLSENFAPNEQPFTGSREAKNISSKWKPTENSKPPSPRSGRFELDCCKRGVRIPIYNALTDVHLQGHFDTKERLHNLQKVRLINKNNQIVNKKHPPIIKRLSRGSGSSSLGKLRDKSRVSMGKGVKCKEEVEPISGEELDKIIKEYKAKATGTGRTPQDHKYVKPQRPLSGNPTQGTRIQPSQEEKALQPANKYIEVDNRHPTQPLTPKPTLTRPNSAYNFRTRSYGSDELNDLRFSLHVRGTTKMRQSMQKTWKELMDLKQEENSQLKRLQTMKSNYSPLVPLIKNHVKSENIRVQTLKKETYNKMLSNKELKQKLWEEKFVNMYEKVYQLPLLVENASDKLLQRSESTGRMWGESTGRNIISEGDDISVANNRSVSQSFLKGRLVEAISGENSKQSIREQRKVKLQQIKEKEKANEVKWETEMELMKTKVMARPLLLEINKAPPLKINKQINMKNRKK